MNISPESNAPPAGRCLIVGCGSIGKRHLSNLLLLGQRDILAFDPRADRRDEVSSKFGVAATADLAAGLKEARVVFVCTPTQMHLEQAFMAAQAGCHVFIEKPVAHTLEGLSELERELRTRRLVSLVGCNFRFHPGLRHVKTLLAEGAIGPITSARAEFGQYLPDWHPWEDYRQSYSARSALGGGVIFDRIHELDYVRWLLGEVNEITALSGKLSRLEIDTEDVAEILLRFESGAFGSVHMDYVRRTYNCSLEIVGQDGTIRWDFPTHEVRWYRVADGCWHSRQWPRYDVNEMYVEQLRHFLRAIAGVENSVLNVHEAARVLAIALAAKEAAEQKQWRKL